MLEGPGHRDVAHQDAPLGQGGPVLLGGAHHVAPGLVVAQQTVDPVDLEGEVRGHAHRGQRRLLAAAGLFESLPVGDRHRGGADGQHQERHQQHQAVDGGQPDAQDDPSRSGDEGHVADPLVVSLGLLVLAVAGLDGREDDGVLSVGAGLLSGLGQVALTVLHLVGHVPQPGLVDAGQRAQVAVQLGAGGQVVGVQAQLGPGLARVDAGPAQHVESLGSGELLGHVRRSLDVHHAVAAALGAEDGVAGPGVRGDLEVDAGPPGSQSPDQLGDESLPFQRSHAGDHRHPAMEVEGVGSLAGLNHESLEVHPQRIGVGGAGLEPDGPLRWAIRPAGRSAAGLPAARSGSSAGTASRWRPGATSELGPGGAAWHDGRSVAAGWQRCAPLAQSAERFHGKEKVDSSILSGGSRAARSTSRPGGPRPSPGGVAQSVRALGS